MKNDMKLIMENWRRTLEENAEQSDGGNILTGKELEQLPSVLNLKSELEAVKNALKKEITNNKGKIDKLRQQHNTKALNEILFTSLYAAMQVSALTISLVQLSAKLSAKFIAPKFGYAPKDPNSEYFNDFHKSVDDVLDFVKRQLQSVGLHAVCLGVAKYIFKDDDVAYEKAKENINLILDGIMIAMSLIMMYGSLDAIKNAKGLEKVMAAFGNDNVTKTVADSIDNAAGLKDFVTSIIKKFATTSSAAA